MNVFRLAGYVLVLAVAGGGVLAGVAELLDRHVAQQLPRLALLALQSGIARAAPVAAAVAICAALGDVLLLRMGRQAWRPAGLVVLGAAYAFGLLGVGFADFVALGRATIGSALPAVSRGVLLGAAAGLGLTVLGAGAWIAHRRLSRWLEQREHDKQHDGDHSRRRTE